MLWTTIGFPVHIPSKPHQAKTGLITWPSPWSISLFGISHSSQVWTGPTDVWKVEVSEESRVLHRRRLDDGVVTPLAQTSNTWGEMVVMWSQRSLFFLMFCSVKGASLWVFLKWSVGQGQFYWWHQVWWDCQRLFDLFFFIFYKL